MIKNEPHASQLGLGQEYYDDKCNHFALVMTESGDWKNEQLFVQVMDMRKKLLGREHPFTLASMENLETTYLVIGLGNPWVIFTDLYPYPCRPIPVKEGYGYSRVGVRGTYDRLKNKVSKM